MSKRRIYGSACALLTFCCLAPAAGAAPGDVDSSFGKKGSIVTTPHAPDDTVLRDFIEAPGNRMLAVGGGTLKQSGVLVRYLNDGRLDQTFGDGGIVTTPTSLWARAVIQPDGKIVTFGRIGKEPAIARFDEAGALDPAFGEGGKLIVDDVRSRFRSPEETLEFLGPGIDSQGRIVAAIMINSCVKSEESPDRKWADVPCPNLPVFRFTADGEPDLTYGDGTGREVLATGLYWRDRPWLIGLAPDGTIVVRSHPDDQPGLGGYGPNVNNRGVVQKFGEDGAAVSSFGDGGLIKYGSAQERDGTIEFDSDGDITIYHQGVLELDADGNPDPRFGRDGFASGMMSLGGSSSLTAHTVTSGGYLKNGGLMLAGTGYRNRSAYAIRTDPRGRPDPRFDNDGLASRRTGQGIGTESRRGLAYAGSIVHPDGSVTVATTSKSNDQFRFKLMRFTGGKGGKRLRCRGELATVQGGPGDDRLFGGEVTVAGPGDDLVRDGGKLLCLGPGDDSATGGVSGDGQVFGGTGDDRLHISGGMILGEAGNDDIELSRGKGFGGGGTDRLASKHGTTSLYGGAMADVVQTTGNAWGGAGDDRITETGYGAKNKFFGGSGDDLMSGGKEPDRIDGGSGRDRINGGKAPDRLFGGAGSDSIDGGPAADILIGGPGLDDLDPGSDGPHFAIYGNRTRKVRGFVKALNGKFVVDALRVWNKCRGSRSGFQSWGMFDAYQNTRIKSSGRFRDEYYEQDDWGWAEGGSIEGRVRPDFMTVTYDHFDYFNGGEGSPYQCETGKLKFRLKRKPNDTAP